LLIIWQILYQSFPCTSWWNPASAVWAAAWTCWWSRRPSRPPRRRRRRRGSPSPPSRWPGGGSPRCPPPWSARTPTCCSPTSSSSAEASREPRRQKAWCRTASVWNDHLAPAAAICCKSRPTRNPLRALRGCNRSCRFRQESRRLPLFPRRFRPPGAVARGACPARGKV